jgi:hypothetical protein
MPRLGPEALSRTPRHRQARSGPEGSPVDASTSYDTQERCQLGSRWRRDAAKVMGSGGRCIAAPGAFFVRIRRGRDQPHDYGVSEVLLLAVGHDALPHLRTPAQKA